MSRWKTLQEDGEQQEAQQPYTTTRRVTYTHDLPLQKQQPTTQPPIKKQPQHNHWLTPVGCGAVIVLGVVCLWTFVVVPTYQHVSDQWNYGNSHVSETDATINGQLEHFIGIDMRGHITVIEIPDTHPEKSRIYQAAQMVGDGNEHRIVLLSFRDVNGDHKDDLVISIEGESGYVVLFQNATGFSWQP